MTEPSPLINPQRPASEPSQSLSPANSLVLGLVGLCIMTLVSVVFATLAIRLSANHSANAAVDLAAKVTIFLALTLIYVSVGFALHWFGSCQIPLAVRLGLVYITLYFAIRVLAFDQEAPQGIHVLMFVPLCAGGFIQKWRGWRALSLAQTIAPQDKLGIRNMLDITAAFALTLAVTQTDDFDPRGFACLIPGSLLMACTGMHNWGRITKMCDNRHFREQGFVMSMTGDTIIALGAFVVAAIGGAAGTVTCVLTLPLMFLVAEGWSRLACVWLRSCGWRMDRRPTVVRSANEAKQPIDEREPTSPLF